MINPNFTDNVFTYVLTDAVFPIVASFGVTAVAMKLISGAATYTGSLTLGNFASAPIPLAVGDPVTIGNNQQAIDILTIDASAGVVYIICRRQ